MPVRVLPLEEADLPTYAHIHNIAFTEGIGRYLGGHNEDAEKAFLEFQRKAFGTDPTLSLLKAVDTETGQILAGAQWHCYDKERSYEEVLEATEKRPCPPNANTLAFDDIYDWLQKGRRELRGGQVCWYLHILVADPGGRRRGAGDALVKWGCEKADEMDLPTWVESSSVAHSLYTRNGFEDVEVKVFDLTKYGGTGTDPGAIMHRKRKSERDG